MSTDEFSIENPSNNAFGRWHRLIPLRDGDPNFSHAKLFRKGWKHPDKARPHVRAIFKILSPGDSLRPYLKYRDSVQALSSAKTTRRPGNELLLFHGTSRACLIGEDDKNVRLCTLPECSLCNVIRGSFDVRKCGSRHKFRRFGTGIYTTSVSSKADDYTSNGAKAATCRALLVNRVVVGRAHKRRNNARHFTAPPSGYHSVVGEPGEDLNYEETVVYRNEAIRPAYVIVYGAAPESKPVASKFKALVTTLFHTPLAS